MKSLGLIGLLLMATLSIAPAFGCGPDTDCRIGDRHYRIRMPEDHDGDRKIGAIVFAHGYKANGLGAVTSKGFAALAQSLNIAIIALKSYGAGWALPNAPSGPPAVDEVAYVDRVMDDATKRFPIDRNRVIVSGFSSGGRMTWTLACERGGAYAGFIPIAGTFWRPVPETCPSPTASIIHLHGDRDRVVPLDGRQIRQAHQGSVARAIEMYGQRGNFGAEQTREFDDLRCRNRANPDGQILNFCMFEGGHIFNLRHLRIAIDMLVDASRIRFGD